MAKKLLLIVVVLINFSCKQTTTTFTPTASTLALLEKSKAIQQRAERVELNLEERQKELSDLLQNQPSQQEIKDDEFVNIEKLSSNFVLDMKYATTDNFLKKAVYPCEKCFVKGVVAKALVDIQKELLRKGYRIKLFDCYRPHSVQKKMWKIMPNPGYVANPKGGSVHNRGAAVDITLTDLKGNELDMGTGFDHFGKEAAHWYKDLSDEVKANRKLLRSTMESHGFTTIRTEWWHYNYVGGKKYKISDFTWKCE